MEVLIGVDPHGKSVNAVAAIDEYGEMVGNEVFPANRNGLRALERWAKRFPERRWAVEGAGGIGRPVAQKLVASGESVVDVPPKLSSKTRLLSTAQRSQERSFGRDVHRSGRRGKRESSSGLAGGRHRRPRRGAEAAHRKARGSGS